MPAICESATLRGGISARQLKVTRIEELLGPYASFWGRLALRGKAWWHAQRASRLARKLAEYSEEYWVTEGDSSPSRLLDGFKSHRDALASIEPTVVLDAGLGVAESFAGAFRRFPRVRRIRELRPNRRQLRALWVTYLLDRESDLSISDAARLVENRLNPDTLFDSWFECARANFAVEDAEKELKKHADIVSLDDVAEVGKSYDEARAQLRAAGRAWLSAISPTSSAYRFDPTCNYAAELAKRR